MAQAIAYTDNATSVASGASPVPVSPAKPLPVTLSGSGGGATTVVVSGYEGITTQTIVTLSAASSAQLIAANSTRKGLKWMNVGLNPMTVVPGAGPAVVNSGMNYGPSPSSGMPGDGEQYEGTGIVTGAFQAISTLGTTIIVWELN